MVFHPLLTDHYCCFHYRMARSTPEKDVGPLCGTELHWLPSDDWPHQLLTRVWIWWYKDFPEVLSRRDHPQHMVYTFPRCQVFVQYWSPFTKLGTSKWHLQVQFQGCTVLGCDIPIPGLWNSTLFLDCNFLICCDGFSLRCHCPMLHMCITATPPIPPRTVWPIGYRRQGHWRLISSLVHRIWKRLTIAGEWRWMSPAMQ